MRPEVNLAKVTFAASIEVVERGRVTLAEERVGGESALVAALLPFVGERHVLITIELDRPAATPWIHRSTGDTK